MVLQLTKFRLLASLFIILVVILGAGYALKQHDAKVRMEVANKVTEQERAQAKIDLDNKLKALQAEASQIKSPEQAVKYLNKYIPLPMPISLGEPLPSALPSTLTIPINSKIDSPIAKPLIIPPSDIIPLTEQVEQCMICETKLSSAVADNKRLSDELKVATKTAKGGNWFIKSIKQAKVIACAGAGAAAGGAKGSAGAAAGAVGGALLCSLF